MALAVVTPKHLEKIGLLNLEKEQLDSNEKVELVTGDKISKSDITYLFRNALEKVLFHLEALASSSLDYIYIYIRRMFVVPLKFIKLIIFIFVFSSPSFHLHSQ